jgi:hypothetical protein
VKIVHRVVAPAAVVLAVLGPAAAPAGGLNLPNLGPRPAFDVRVGAPDRGSPFRFALRFSTWTANLGDYPFELLGAPPRDAERTAAQQCVLFASRGCLDRRDVGDFSFHPAHGNWHLDDYALYELRALLPDGTPDMSTEGIAASGGKISFCLLDYEPTEERSPLEDPFVAGFYVGCSGVLQGISVGWADTYEWRLEGQQIPLDTVQTGDYALMISVDPDGHLLETTREDNVSIRKLAITNTGSAFGVALLD